ncbi:MAG TPA: amino acid adenylation domain-containing protein [Verrucomicrobiae bacterium]|nr:amino acid adenylation domain-containing protein [Verrucomicrobiae bacterium]
MTSAAGLRASGALFSRITEAAVPEGLALVGPDGGLTYAEMLDRAGRLAARLARRRSPVLVYGQKQPAVLVGFLAALRLGRAYVPIDSSLPPGRVARMLAVVGSEDAVLVEEPPPPLARELEARGIATIGLDPLAACLTRSGETIGGADPPPPAPETPAYILFTSGTSGVPKGVPVSHAALAHFTSWLLASHSFARGAETFLGQAPFSFDLSVMDVYGALLTGGTLFAITREEIADPRRLFRRLDGAPLTTWVSTPSFARFCLAEARFARPMLPALRRFLFCGETLSAAVVRGLLARFPGVEVWNMYGPTETTVAVTAVRIGPELAASDHPLPVGHPAPGMDIWIADPDAPSRRAPDGAGGEIVIAGPQVAAGYLTDTALGSPDGRFFTLADGRRAYRTGDLGWIDPGDGALFCAGRLDHQIKLRGYRIEIEEIETHLRAVPGVADAAVVAVDRDGQPDHLVALVVVTPALSATRRALTSYVRAALADCLPEYAVPRIVRSTPALPLTSHGKLDRRALREIAG